jgi:hypothetical protein
MKRIVATLILTCVLCVSALAGEIPTCNPAPLSATGDVPTAGSEAVANSSTVSSETESSVLTDVLLILLTLIAR